MEPLQLAFLHPIKALFYKDACWPWGGLDPVSSQFIYVFQGGGHWAQVRRIDYSSTGKRSFSSCRPKITAFAFLLPITFRAWMSKGCLPGCRSPSHLWDASCTHVTVHCHLPEWKVFKNRLVKISAPKVIPPGHFYALPEGRIGVCRGSYHSIYFKVFLIVIFQSFGI